jgi:hypothetical protein
MHILVRPAACQSALTFQPRCVLCAVCCVLCAAAAAAAAAAAGIPPSLPSWPRRWRPARSGSSTRAVWGFMDGRAALRWSPTWLICGPPECCPVRNGWRRRAMPCTFVGRVAGLAGVLPCGPCPCQIQFQVCGPCSCQFFLKNEIEARRPGRSRARDARGSDDVGRQPAVLQLTSGQPRQRARLATCFQAVR